MVDEGEKNKKVVLFNYGMMAGIQALCLSITKIPPIQSAREEIEQLTKSIEELPCNMVAAATETGTLPDVAFLDGYKTGQELFFKFLTDFQRTLK